jgi:hypothetical protein
MKDLHRRSFERAEKGYGVNKVADISFDEQTGNIVMKGKYKITLPQFGTWDDLYSHLSDKWIACDNLSAFLEIIKEEYPHGVRIGDKYIQK